MYFHDRLDFHFCTLAYVHKLNIAFTEVFIGLRDWNDVLRLRCICLTILFFHISCLPSAYSPLQLFSLFTQNQLVPITICRRETSGRTPHLVRTSLQILFYHHSRSSRFVIQQSPQNSHISQL